MADGGEQVKRLPTTKTKKNKQGGISKMSEPARAISITTQPSSPASLKPVHPSDLFKRVQELQDLIARRAFELFDWNGKTLGHDLEDWFKAESELLHPVHVNVSESGGNVIVTAEVPGFTAKDLDVALEPRRVTITGKRETKEERKNEKTIYTEIRSDQVLRVIDLPAGVDTDKAAATLKDGVLELRMPKAAPAKKLQIAAIKTKPDEKR
jgi:HSP20 family protein